MPSKDAAAAVLASRDAQARARALDASVSLLVRAPAGSGKTELLIQRFLKVLATVEEPEAVVALTFSRKAAAEMRDRLLAALTNAAGGAPEKEHQRLTWELARSARARGEERGWGLLATPARLRVVTLDGLALELARRMPWLSRLGGAPRPTEEAGPLYTAASRATLRRIESDGAAGDAARHLVARMGADVDATVELLVALLEKRDQWLHWAGTTLAADPAAVRAALEAAIAERVARELATIRQRLTAAGMSGLPPDDPAAWAGLAAEVLTKAGTPRKKGPCPDLNDGACAALERAGALPAAALNASQANAVEALVALLPVAVGELKLAFRDAGACDFTEITLAAVEALGDDAAPSALAFALDARIQHLFVDEFQDTSHAQHALLRRLVGDWQPGDGRTLFVVGDPMQSIYGFRNAEVRLFLAAEQAQRLGTLPLESIELSRNFRSAPAVVEWVNTTFAPALSQAEGNVGYTDAAAAHAGDGGVEVHALPGQARAAEAARVAELVDQAEAEMAPGETVAILAQNRSHLRLILPELRRRNIAFQGSRLLPLGESPVVADLTMLARAVHDRGDRIAWLAALRAPWCGLTLADLHALCAGDGDATVEELWAARRERLSAGGQRRGARTMAVLQAAARWAGRQPAAALVAWCWRELDGAGCLAKTANPADADAFFRRLETLPGPGFDLQRLEAALDGLYAPPDPRADGRVVVMTAHNAKGLEFDTVILPGLDRWPKNDTRHLMHWVTSDVEDESLLVAPRPEVGAGNDALYDFVRGLEKRRQQQEQARLLYVAATRAKRRLHLLAKIPQNKKTGAFSHPDPRSTLARVWTALADEFLRQFEAHRTLQAEEELTEAPETPPPSIPPLRRVAKVPEASGEIQEPAGLAAAAALETPGSPERALGVALHAMLQEIAETGSWDPARLRLRLQAAGVYGAELDPLEARASQALEAMLADPQGRWILEPHAEARCEWTITGVIDGHAGQHILDRTFVDADGTRWIVDYKTSMPADSTRHDEFINKEAERYRPQLDRYAKLLTAMGMGPIRCGLYFPLFGGWREWPYI